MVSPAAIFQTLEILMRTQCGLLVMVTEHLYTEGNVNGNIKLSPVGPPCSCPGFSPSTNQDHRSDVVLLVCTSQNSLPGR